MASRFIDLDDLDPADEQAWRRLADRSIDSNPFFEPDFVIPAARHLGARSSGLSSWRRTATGSPACR